MASLKLGLDKRRIKSDGTFPLVFKLNLNRKQLLIKTKDLQTFLLTLQINIKMSGKVGMIF